jgi:hypothetical protein
MHAGGEYVMMKLVLGAALVAAAMSCSALTTPSQAGSAFTAAHVVQSKPHCTRGIIGCLHVQPKPHCTRGIIGCR